MTYLSEFLEWLSFESSCLLSAPESAACASFISLFLEPVVGEREFSESISSFTGLHMGWKMDFSFQYV